MTTNMSIINLLGSRSFLKGKSVGFHQFSGKRGLWPNVLGEPWVQRYNIDFRIQDLPRSSMS